MRVSQHTSHLGIFLSFLVVSQSVSQLVTYLPLTLPPAIDSQWAQRSPNRSHKALQPPTPVTSTRQSLPVPKLSSPHREHRPESIRFEKNLHPAGVSYTGTFINLATLKNEIRGNSQFIYPVFFLFSAQKEVFRFNQSHNQISKHSEQH